MQTLEGGAMSYRGIVRVSHLERGVARRTLQSLIDHGFVASVPLFRPRGPTRDAKRPMRIYLHTDKGAGRAWWEKTARGIRGR